MTVTIIVATRNRASALPGCLDSLAAAIAQAAPAEIEIIVVDNGSTDQTAEVARRWAETSPAPVRVLHEPRPGLSRAHNRAIRAARGELLVFTDDDCRMESDYLVRLLRHAAATTGAVFWGGRVELGDPTDLPLTIVTTRARLCWRRAENSARREPLAGRIHGCNMVMRRGVVARVGLFDEDLGSGAYINSGGDTDYLYRVYLAGIPIEYLPDLVVHHHHGRKSLDEARRLVGDYSRANGALYLRYFFRDPVLCRKFFLNARNALKEVLSGRNQCWPELGITARAVLGDNLRGMLRFSLMKLGIRHR